ncbi:MAG: hypothetical protein AAB635_00280 [Patescibacteria group bacterium]
MSIANHVLRGLDVHAVRKEVRDCLTTVGRQSHSAPADPSKILVTPQREPGSVPASGPVAQTSPSCDADVWQARLRPIVDKAEQILDNPRASAGDFGSGVAHGQALATLALAVATAVMATELKAACGETTPG